MALDPIWYGVFVLVIRHLNPFDQPFGKPLLRDGFNFVLSAVGNEELGSALLPDLTGSPQVLVQSVSDKESAKRPHPSGGASLAQR